MSNAKEATDASSPQPIIRGEKVWLRAIEPSELIEGAQLLSDAEIAHFTGFKAPLSRAGAERFANKVMEQGGRNPTLFVFGIVPLGEQTRIGNVSLRDVNQLNGSAELAIVVSAPGRLGKGYGTDAVNAILDFGFGELRLERIELRVFDYNTRAVRSYEKSGFQTDAVQRHARFHRGVLHDVLVMSILRDDWLALPRPKSWELAGP
jgi:RimJ/RimL family protein N-acetyltransferase